MKRIFLCVTLTFAAFCLSGQLRLPNVIGDHMVLQQKTDAPLWGWAGPGEEIQVTVSWDKEQVVKVKTTNQATWHASVKTPPAGGPYVITIKGSSNASLTINDVMIGEVWICSGQSNMEWNVWNGAEDAKADAPNANFPNIRLMQVAKSSANAPQDRGEGQWQPCTPETMKGFSAVAYFFGKKLHSDLKVPIGLINVSWGGTPAEVWTAQERIDNDPELKAANDRLTQFDWWPKKPGGAYNGMIHPLIPYAIAGVIWYQGEGNTIAPASYEKLMEAMVGGWRADFGREFPFYYVQIAPYEYGKKYEGALIREQQSKFLAYPKTGMVIISDAVDDVKNIHPKMKKPVGDRLANLALASAYHVGILGAQSPVYKSMTIERSRARISFDYAEIGLISHNGEPTQFMVAGEDRKFYPATAKIDGGTVLVSAKEVKVPVAVRFCFDNASIPNLFNKEGLPVSIFRTDDWPLD